MDPGSVVVEMFSQLVATDSLDNTVAALNAWMQGHTVFEHSSWPAKWQESVLSNYYHRLC